MLFLWWTFCSCLPWFTKVNIVQGKVLTLRWRYWPGSKIFQPLAAGAVLGIKSYTGGPHNLFLGLVQDILAAVEKSEVGKARDLQKKLSEGQEAVRREGEINTSKKVKLHIFWKQHSRLFSEPFPIIALLSKSKERLSCACNSFTVRYSKLWNLSTNNELCM